MEDTLSAALGQEMTSQIALKPIVSVGAGAGRGWLRMVLMLNDELSRPDSALSQRLVAEPFIDSFICALLVATDHPYRGLLAAEAKQVAPRTIRTAIEIIESECHLPLTLPQLAVRSQVSIRALQQAFQRHFGVSTMTYVRQVRLRRAHQELLDADPSVGTIAAIAKRWGFTNPGRFAAIHADRYGEAPAVTLGRSASRRIAEHPRSNLRLEV
jgi:AraC-like DNA-binding protein